LLGDVGYLIQVLARGRGSGRRQDDQSLRPGTGPRIQYLDRGPGRLFPEKVGGYVGRLKNGAQRRGDGDKQDVLGLLAQFAVGPDQLTGSGRRGDEAVWVLLDELLGFRGIDGHPLGVSLTIDDYIGRRHHRYLIFVGQGFGDTSHSVGHNLYL
jgi:hypothetical protein